MNSKKKLLLIILVLGAIVPYVGLWIMDFFSPSKAFRTFSNNIDISSDGNYIAYNTASEVVLWSRASSSPLWSNADVIDVPSGAVDYGDVKISANGSYIAVADKHELFLFHKSSPNPLWSYYSNDEINALAISSNGSYVAIVDAQSKLFCFEFSSSTPIWNFTVSDLSVDLSFSADNRFILVCTHTGPELFNTTNSLSPFIRTYATEGMVWGSSISSNGSYIAAYSDNRKLYFFEYANSIPNWTYTAGYDIKRIDMSSDGENIIIGGLRNQLIIQLFGKYGSNVIREYLGSITNEPDIKISADGNYIFAAAHSSIICFKTDSSNHIWAIPSFPIFSTPIGAIELETSSDGSYIAVASHWNAYLLSRENPFVSDMYYYTVLFLEILVFSIMGVIAVILRTRKKRIERKSHEEMIDSLDKQFDDWEKEGTDSKKI